jgi:hypothetical protein
MLSLSVATPMLGCGGDSGPDPTIKVETGKSIAQSTVKGWVRPGVKLKDPAPIQRTKATPK